MRKIEEQITYSAIQKLEQKVESINFIFDRPYR